VDQQRSRYDNEAERQMPRGQTHKRGRGSAGHSVATDNDKEDAAWPGTRPTNADEQLLQTVMANHKNQHTVQDALHSMHKLHEIMMDLASKCVIPNRNAMQVYLQHCCVKSASFEAEAACFNAAFFALDLIERHDCKFDVKAAVDIAMQTSLRAAPSNLEVFARRLVRKTLTHLNDHERAFVAKHMTFALLERRETFHESIASSTFAEKGIRIDWGDSSAQDFQLYNVEEDAVKSYQPSEGYGFGRKGLAAVLSIDLERSGLLYSDYHWGRDGALVDIVKADSGEPIVARAKTQVSVPFVEGALYRLDSIDTAEVQTRRLLETLRVVGRDAHPSCQRAQPDSLLCKMLCLPAEEPYNVRLVLRPRCATLEEELDENEGTAEPLRVRCIGTGILSEWNRANPGQEIHVGDRVLKIQNLAGEVMTTKASIIDEIEHARNGPYARHGCALRFTFMKKVKMQDHHLDTEPLMPNATDIEDAIRGQEEALRQKLNESQIEAVRRAATQRLCLIQGPPGTGKTTTALELLDFLLTNQFVPTPILVSGPSNAAVDNLLLGLVKRGRRVVRMGEGDKIREECKPYLYGKGELAVEPRIAEVICATCIGSGSGVFAREGITFHTVLIDECSQATEAACLVPICHAAKQVILVGDQCQLQPFMRSELAKHDDLGCSLFNRLCQQGMRPAMLDTQYRMHPGLCMFPSDAFYNGQLFTGVSRDSRAPTKHWDWPSARAPACFIDATEGQETDNYENPHEVRVVLDVLKQLLRDRSLRRLGEDGAYPVAIVTPYAAQKKLIVNEVCAAGFVDAKGNPLVETNSVDGFQGREKDVIIFSAVRANYSGSVGFLHDWRRINVMLTRAKSGLVVIGHRETLQTDVYWRNWLKWAAAHGCIQGERAVGTWKPMCLIDEEWVMNPLTDCEPSKTSSVQCALATGMSTSLQQEQDSWEGYGHTINSTPLRVSRHSEEETIDSWEDLAPSPLASKSMQNKMQEAPTSTLPPNRDDEPAVSLPLSRAGTTQQARIFEASGGAGLDSWEDLATPIHAAISHQKAAREETLASTQPSISDEQEWGEVDSWEDLQIPHTEKMWCQIGGLECPQVLETLTREERELDQDEETVELPQACEIQSCDNFKLFTKDTEMAIPHAEEMCCESGGSEWSKVLETAKKEERELDQDEEMVEVAQACEVQSYDHFKHMPEELAPINITDQPNAAMERRAEEANTLAHMLPPGLTALCAAPGYNYTSVWGTCMGPPTLFAPAGWRSICPAGLACVPIGFQSPWYLSQNCVVGRCNQTPSMCTGAEAHQNVVCVEPTKHGPSRKRSEAGRDRQLVRWRRRLALHGRVQRCATAALAFGFGSTDTSSESCRTMQQADVVRKTGDSLNGPARVHKRLQNKKISVPLTTRLTASPNAIAGAAVSPAQMEQQPTSQVALVADFGLDGASTEPCELMQQTNVVHNTNDVLDSPSRLQKRYQNRKINKPSGAAGVSGADSHGSFQNGGCITRDGMATVAGEIKSDLQETLMRPTFREVLCRRAPLRAVPTKGSRDR
jgi:DNA polymerase III delta prime subunit